MDPAIFLDRDGTLVPDDANAGVPARVSLVEGVAPSLRRLRDAGFRLVVATNQGGVARGRFSEVDVDAVHARLSELLDQQTGLKRTIERFYYCPFHPKGTIPEYTREHPWRKPKPGMLLQAAQDLELEIERSWLIGDSPRDVAAGRAAGLRTILVSRDKARIADAAADYSASTLGEAVEIVLRHRDETTSSVAVARAVAAKRPTRGGRRRRQTGRLRRGIAELTEEIRALRLRRAEASPVRLAAMCLQLVAVLVAGVAFLNLSDVDNFLRWGAATMMLQLVTITLLLFDRQP
jgi:histidinol-phosphate phosphatase family protein